MKVKEALVHSTGSAHLAFFHCYGAWPESPEVLVPSPRRAAFSSGVGVLGSSSTGPNREASIASSPLMVINEAMHC